jgi:hypothetical protein
MRQQLRQPGRVVGIGLAPRDSSHLRRIGQDQGEPALGQDGPERLPAKAGRLHGGMGAALRREPRGQREQACGRGAERPPLPDDLAAVHGEAHAGDDGVLVDVETGAKWVEDLHRALPCRAPPAWGPGRGSPGSMLRAEPSPLAQAGVLEGPRVQPNNGLARTKKTANLAAGGAAPLHPSFMPGGSEVLRWATRLDLSRQG